MTEITANIDIASRTGTRVPPSGILLNLIVAILAPIFLGVTAGDVSLARMAALETINDYRARNHADLVAVAQIVACGLAALGSLSLSMADDLSLSMILRLRGNAIALNRSAEQNRRALTKSLASDPVPYQAPMAAEPEVTLPEDDTPSGPDMLLSPAAAQELAAEAEARLREPKQTSVPSPAPNPPTEKRLQEMWAIALVSEASEINAGIANLPPAERKIATIRAAALSSTANDLLYGGPAPLPPVAIGGHRRP
jgi:hypothetical protein